MHQKPEIGGSTIKTTLNPACKKKNDSGITDTVTSVFAERKRERSKEFGSARFQQNENKQSQILKF